jgi:hypothetical protein
MPPDTPASDEDVSSFRVVSFSVLVGNRGVPTDPPFGGSDSPLGVSPPPGNHLSAQHADAANLDPSPTFFAFFVAPLTSGCALLTFFVDLPFGWLVGAVRLVAFTIDHGVIGFFGRVDPPLGVVPRNVLPSELTYPSAQRGSSVAPEQVAAMPSLVRRSVAFDQAFQSPTMGGFALAFGLHPLSDLGG